MNLKSYLTYGKGVGKKSKKVLKLCLQLIYASEVQSPGQIWLEDEQHGALSSCIRQKCIRKDKPLSRFVCSCKRFTQQPLHLLTALFKKISIIHVGLEPVPDLWALSLVDLKPSLLQVTSRSEATGTGTRLYWETCPTTSCGSCRSSPTAPW